MLTSDPARSTLIQRKNAAAQSKPKDSEEDRNKATNWGRSWNISFLTTFFMFSLLVFCPILVAGFLISCTSFQCSIQDTVLYTMKFGIVDLYNNYFPKPTTLGFQLYYGWLLFQAAMYMIIPAKIGYGQMTPAGYKLPYCVNGLRVWIITHVLYLTMSVGLGWFKASIIADNWGALFIAANSYGYALTAFSYIKAHLFPSHPADRKFSNSKLYDLFMGIEFNPRIGSFDFKLFHNGRPGIVAWTLINISFAAAQFNEIGYVTNSMLLLNGIHMLYVVDFFYNEVKLLIGLVFANN